MSKLQQFVDFFDDIHVRKFCKQYELSYRYISFILTGHYKLSKNYEYKIQSAIIDWAENKQTQVENLCIKQTKKVKKSLAI